MDERDDADEGPTNWNVRLAAVHALAQVATPLPAEPTEATGPERARARARAVFVQLDRDGNGKVSRTEFLMALREDPALATVFHLPSRIRQEDGSRDAFERVFQGLDTDGDRSLSWDEIAVHLLQEEAAEKSDARVLAAASTHKASQS